ncbi:MAG: iron-containing alcohol dehydrogenase [Candidatus Omnitrophica bacterium]|nr:iron-containing alcohol dehydrogenase [Candidatus Omnitrophota bacterium]
MIKKFTFLCKPEVIYGQNSITQLPEVVKSLGGKKLLLVTDRNFSKTETFTRIKKLLKEKSIEYVVFDNISGEPSTETGDECALFGKNHNCDIVCGIGGGSTLDTAKAAAVLITNGGSVHDYQGLDKVPGPGLPKIMIPTTAGTGSEVTFTAVFIRRAEKKKGGINSKYLYPEVAILDPLLTLTVPQNITASTGLDALCHAIESFISKKANFLTEPVSLSAIKLIMENLPPAYKNGSDIKSRESMLYGSFLAGVCLANAGVTAVHSISYPLGGVFGIPHGIGNGLLLPYVIEFDIPEIAPKLASIYDYIYGHSEKKDIEKAEVFISEIKQMLKRFKIPRLKELGVSHEAFHSLAEDAIKVAVPIENNPKPITVLDIIKIYQAAF